MRRIVLLIILSAFLPALPATALPFCDGKSENCAAAHAAEKLSPTDRRLAAECFKCMRESWKLGRSVGGRCPGNCADFYSLGE